MIRIGRLIVFECDDKTCRATCEFWTGRFAFRDVAEDLARNLGWMIAPKRHLCPAHKDVK